jgi:hypothetical protein
MLSGLMLVTWAGLQKESQSAKRDDTSVGHEVRYAKAQHNCVVWVLMAVLAGILSAGLNFSFAFGHSVAATTRAAGASRTTGTYAVWALAMLGGTVPNCSVFHSWVRLFSMASERSDSVCWEHQWDGSLCK